MNEKNSEMEKLKNEPKTEKEFDEMYDYLKETNPKLYEELESDFFAPIGP